MRASIALVALATIVTAPTAAPQQPSRLLADSGRFLLDGRPFQIISGEMHYARVPREYWSDRLRKARAMGLNTISTYVFWNLHEATPGHYDFSGQKDVAEFIRLAQEEGLHVILRPGPYVCAEWDLGGLPAWLLADTSIVLRSTDPRFTGPAARWLDRLGAELKPLLASHGGPIIAVQVENEYGSFDRDTQYLAWQRDALRHAGFGDVLLYTADGDVQLPNGTLPGLPAVVNFGTGDADSSFARLRRFRPAGPMMSGEYWAGWFDQWGRPHARTDAARQASDLAWMLARGYSVNLYMFHGGSTFGFMNGANIDGGRYFPQTSSYDYDAALDQAGRPTAKYASFRSVIAAHTREALPPVPGTPAAIAVAPFALAPLAPIWTTLGAGVPTDRPVSMERLGQSYGYIVYRTTIPAGGRAWLVVRDVRDYARIFVDGRYSATLDRRLAEDSAEIDVPARGSVLDIVVENSGRVNFAKPLRTEWKGITHAVTLGGVELRGWRIFPLPMSQEPAPRRAPVHAGDPAFYAGRFTVDRAVDTFLDTRGWGKGVVWVNGHNLGRFWSIGPQQTLYVPGPWLHPGANDIVVFDLSGPAPGVTTMSGRPSPILDELHPDRR